VDTDTREDLRSRCLVALDAVGDAATQLVGALQDGDRARVLVRDHLVDGGEISEIDRLIEPESVRATVSRSIVELERARHDAQRLLFQLLYSEGQTMTDIGRMWGISRQLVSRLINEPGPDDEP
jgi:DNA-directed RNA polymerase specialized sigma subunit